MRNNWLARQSVKEFIDRGLFLECQWGVKEGNGSGDVAKQKV